MGDITFFDKHATLIYEILTKHGFFIQTFKKWYHFTELTSFLRGLFLRHFFTPQICYLINFRKKKCKSTLLKTAIFYTTFFYVKIFLGHHGVKSEVPVLGRWLIWYFQWKLSGKRRRTIKVWFRAGFLACTTYIYAYLLGLLGALNRSFLSVKCF